jgi:hypothetical protein
VSQPKDKQESANIGWLFGRHNNCYGNSLSALQAIVRGGGKGWFYVEGTIRAEHESEAIHHAWLCNGRSIIDPTQPHHELIYAELRRWPAEEFLKIAAEDIELPLTDMTGALRPQGPSPPE